MKTRKYDYSIVVQFKPSYTVQCQRDNWEDIETVQTDSQYLKNLDYTAPKGNGNEWSARKQARYLLNESKIAYGGGFEFRTIQRRTPAIQVSSN